MSPQNTARLLSGLFLLPALAFAGPARTADAETPPAQSAAADPAAANLAFAAALEACVPASHQSPHPFVRGFVIEHSISGMDDQLCGYSQTMPGDDIPGQLSEDLPVHRPGAKRALVVPFALLVVGVLVGIVWSGVRASGSWAPLDLLAEADVTWSLLVGVVPALAASLYYYARDTASNPKFGRSTFGRGWWEGLRSMWPAVSILLLAWMLGSLIDSLGTGEYLGGLVEDSSLPTEWLVPVVFLVALAMAFATGTSWGSFGLLLPIAGGIVNAVDAPELLLPVLGAVLAGAVAGDHASPISDTTILSSTGAGCNVITHVTTQLPYVAVAVVSATLGYCGLALTGSTTIGFLVTMVVGVAIMLGARRLSPPLDALPDSDHDSEAVSA